jgi:hypothetical protein
MTSEQACACAIPERPPNRTGACDLQAATAAWRQAIDFISQWLREARAISAHAAYAIAELNDPDALSAFEHGGLETPRLGWPGKPA